MSLPEIQDQIRATRIVASAVLRERVRSIAAANPAASPPRRELPWRRVSFVLIPAAVAAVLAVTLSVGLLTSGKSNRQIALGEPVKEGAKPTLPLTDRQPTGTDVLAAPTRPKSTGTGGFATSQANLPATAGRAQLYESELTLKVKDLSAATKRALRLTRAFNGYVRSVEYGSGTEHGTAYLVLRVPVGSVQEAIVKFSAIGTILDQHVSIQDVQPQLDKRFRQMQSIRDQVARLQAKLQSPALTKDERAALENQVVTYQRQIVLLQRKQTQLERQTSFATVSIDLRSSAKAAAVPGNPNRIQRALDRSGSILLDELKVIVYVLLVGAPLFVLGAFGLGSLRVRRRRTESRLLASS